MTRTLLAVRGIERTTELERRRLIQIADELAIDVDSISAVIARESAWNPRAKNPGGSASGLLQWIETTAKGLGTTTAAIRAMSILEQLELVKAYFRPYRGRIRTPADAQMAVFMPAFVGKPLDTVVAAKDGTRRFGKVTEAEVYEKNKAYDRDRKGYITVGDVTDSVRRTVAAAQSKPRIVVAMTAGAPPPAPPSPSSSSSDGEGLALLLALAWFLATPFGVF